MVPGMPYDPVFLGQQVCNLRRELCWSQEALALQAGVSRNYISMIERGKAGNVSASVLGRLASALGVGLDALIRRYGVTVVSAALRRVALEEGLAFDVVDWLAHMPGKAPKQRSVEEWRRIYEDMRPYLCVEGGSEGAPLLKGEARA